MRISNGVKIAAVYGSVFLGAGFVSGRELLQYFVGFGPIGLVGIIAAGVFFAFVGLAVLTICRREGIENYSSLMAFLLGSRFGAVMEGLVAAFLFCLFAAMLAGAGATGNQAFGLPFTFGAAAVGLAVFFVLCFGLDGVVKINVFLAPFMLLGGIFVGLFSFFTYTNPAFSGLAGGFFGLAWLLSAVVYASYNLVTGVPVLAATSVMTKSRRDAWVGGLLGGGVITILGLSMSLPLFLHYTNIIALEIPFLHIASGYGRIFNTLYLAVLIVSLFTTAVCNAFAVLEWVKNRGSNLHKIKIAALLCGVAVLAAHVGFSNIVAYVYPVFGLIGLFMIIIILLSVKRGKI